MTTQTTYTLESRTDAVTTEIIGFITCASSTQVHEIAEITGVDKLRIYLNLCDVRDKYNKARTESQQEKIIEKLAKQFAMVALKNGKIG